MNRRILTVVAVILVIVGIFTMSSLFIVDQTEEALVLQFGQPRRVIREPGPAGQAALCRECHLL